MPLSGEELAASVEGVAMLRDPVRRALYLYVAATGRAVGRDEAAQAVGAQRGLAAFHLDKLVSEGLLETTYRRLSGRTGPGAGRPAKLYRRSGRQLDVTLPPREYELAARLLVRAVDGDDGRPARERLHEAAFEQGVAMGGRARATGGQDDPAALVDAAMAVLRDHGFEPYDETGVIYLRNCPFHSLACEHPELVCGMNLSLISGMLAGLRSSHLLARLDPEPGRCCVALDRAAGQLPPANPSPPPH